LKVNHSQYTVAEIVEMMQRKDLVINRSYQRSSGIWPEFAKSYFIDTILEGYPFPKVYFYQTYDKSRKKPLREVVDGQQRIAAIVDFFNNKFKLTSASKNYCGKSFLELPEDKQQEFTMSTVLADVILAAERYQLLEMFRRMNAYTVPLNSQEKRHSTFQGRFKWFINDLTDEFSPFLEEFQVFTPKQILRMADAEFFAELVIVLEKGIVHKANKAIDDMYRRFDKVFPNEKRYHDIIAGFFKEIMHHFGDLRGTFMMKSYVMHSLFASMVHLRYGIPGGLENLGIEPIGVFYSDLDRALEGLQELAAAHETQDTDGELADYVRACLNTTTKAAQRATRSKTIMGYLS